MDVDWRSPEGIEQAHALRAHYAPTFTTMSQVDALGHRLLKRTIDALSPDRLETLVAAALLRRLVSQYVGIRHLLESSAVEQTKPLVRAQFETLLASKAILTDETTRQLATPDVRERRARYYLVEADRRRAYNLQAMLDGVSGESLSGPDAEAAFRADVASIISQLHAKFAEEMDAFGPMRHAIPGKRPLYHDDVAWYTLARPLAKPKSLRSLAESLGRGWEYHTMYGALSGAAHARGIAHDVKIVPPNRLEVFHPYMADGFELIVHWSTMWQLDVLLLATNAFHPASRPDFEAVYRRHAPALDALSSEPPDGFFEEGA